MNNKEKYAEQLLSFACAKYDSFGVYEGTDEMESCKIMTCEECAFFRMKNSCHTEKLKWLDQEYIKKPVISKKDRAFLEYLGKDLKYIARDKSEALFTYERAIEKGKYGWVYDSGVLKNLRGFSVDLPMVKWSDDSPWLIEDLKQLEVVDNYE